MNKTTPYRQTCYLCRMFIEPEHGPNWTFFDAALAASIVMLAIMLVRAWAVL
jgi:hypothetical protein